MHRAAQLHFKLLSPEAQRAAIWRLAWTGLTPEQIAQRTGLTAEQVSRVTHDETTPIPPTWARRPERFFANA